MLLAGALLAQRDLRGTLQLSRATQQIVLDLQRARIRAIAENRDFRLKFESGRERYRLERDEPSGWTLAGEPSLPAGTRIVACSAPGGVVRFTARGNAAAFGTVTLENSHGARRRVIVNIAGRARVTG